MCIANTPAHNDKDRQNDLTVYVCVYMYICIYVYMYICIYVYMYICIYVYMFICILQTHLYTVTRTDRMI